VQRSAGPSACTRTRWRSPRQTQATAPAPLSAGRQQVLQIPVIKPKAVKRLLAGIGPRPALLGVLCTPTVDDPLDVVSQRIGSLLGKDPSKWEQTGELVAFTPGLHVAACGADGVCMPAAFTRAQRTGPRVAQRSSARLRLAARAPSAFHSGEPKIDTTTSEDGTKRIITKTGVFLGTELHLWAVPPHYDPRLPVRPERPDLTFDNKRREINSTEKWQQVSINGH
jgi:hypothetical protein